jgi:hypothetical protein
LWTISGIFIDIVRPVNTITPPRQQRRCAVIKPETGVIFGITELGK